MSRINVKIIFVYSLAQKGGVSRACTLQQSLTFKFEPVRFFFRRPIDRATKSIRRLFLRAYKTSALCLAKQYRKAPAEFSCAAEHWRTAGWEPERPPATSAVIGSRLFSKRSIRPRIGDAEFSSNGLKMSLVDCNNFHTIALHKIIYSWNQYFIIINLSEKRKYDSFSMRTLRSY